VYGLQHNYAAAKGDLDRAVSLNSNLKEIYESRALIQLLTGRPDLAAKDFSSAIALGASDTLVYYNRAVARSLMGDTRNAEQDYARACGRGYNPACLSSLLVAKVSNPAI
jgi:Flp pilus assembly protein TadD